MYLIGSFSFCTLLDNQTDKSIIVVSWALQYPTYRWKDKSNPICGKINFKIECIQKLLAFLFLTSKLQFQIIKSDNCEEPADLGC